ncbi:MAG: hypothetical protein GY745_12730 [Actinomycetia bacterium]|nr:hypothetical protein [Actinomycetes bacterium]MCP4085902.1 hypothetical protein [Actinomycetes bacterium]
MDQWIREASDEAERLNRNIMIAIVGLVAIYATVAMANAAAIAASERQARVRHPMGPGDRDRGADHDRHRHHNTAHSTGRRLGRLLLGAGSTT